MWLNILKDNKWFNLSAWLQSGMPIFVFTNQIPRFLKLWNPYKSRKVLVIKLIFSYRDTSIGGQI